MAAVYNVPLAATVFVLETLLVAWSVPMVLAALLACGVAVLVVRVGLGDTVQYAHLPNLETWRLMRAFWLGRRCAAC